ncbi:MAG: D-aminoacyl-tRNA deacylase [Gammaproteobacteria bacterium]|nr:D-aminoacyl-tRNA deacylase [Gammaproteobacteria bacterium]
MIGLLQRVNESSVTVNNQIIGKINQGILVLVGVQKGDDEAKVERLASRLLTYRVFPDSDDKMNLSVQDINGGVLLVPQFTLAADTRKGTRASFTSAAPPDIGQRLFDQLVGRIKSQHPDVATGEFGADMKVSLLNDGPVTFWLEV